MDQAFEERIERSDKLALQEFQEEALEVVRERLATYDMAGVSEGVVRKPSYTYYHDWETDSPSLRPSSRIRGCPGEHVIMETNEYLELGEGYDVHDANQIDRRFGTRWLATSRYTPFTAGFVEICRKHGLVSTDREWWQYLLSGAFFNDFYMADVIKYRGANQPMGAVKTTFSSHLIHKLEYVDPDLVIAFGKQAWETLRTQLGAEAIGDPRLARASMRFMDCSTLHPVVGYGRLPLGHPSTNFRGAQISHEGTGSIWRQALKTGPKPRNRTRFCVRIGRTRELPQSVKSRYVSTMRRSISNRLRVTCTNAILY